jgi:hypothetical protein
LFNCAKFDLLILFGELLELLELLDVINVWLVSESFWLVSDFDENWSNGFGFDVSLTRYSELSNGFDDSGITDEEDIVCCGSSGESSNGDVVMTDEFDDCVENGVSVECNGLVTGSALSMG